MKIVCVKKDKVDELTIGKIYLQTNILYSVYTLVRDDSNKETYHLFSNFKPLREYNLDKLGL